MQEMHFEMEQGISYLVVSAKQKIMRNHYRCAVLEQVSIPSFLNYSIRELNGEQRIYYKMSYRVTLKQILGDLQLSYNFVKAMVGSIVDAITQAREYLLDINEVVWKTDAVFVEVNTGRLQFLYFPANRATTDSLKQFLGEIIPFVEKKDQQAYLYIMGFYNLITNARYSMEELTYYGTKEEDTKCQMVDYDMENIMDGKNLGERKPVKRHEEDMIGEQPVKSIAGKKQIHGITLAVVASLVLIEILLLLFEILPYQYIWIIPVSLLALFFLFMTYRTDTRNDSPDAIMEDYFREQKNQTVKSMLIQEVRDEVVVEETTVLSENEEIVVEEHPKEKYLASKNPAVAKDIFFHKSGIMLGTMVSACDVIITQKGISRMHAKICIRETGIYVLDLNSTNGTYLNGERLNCGDEYPLEVGDILSLARIVEFEMKEKEGSDM